MDPTEDAERRRRASAGDGMGVGLGELDEGPREREGRAPGGLWALVTLLPEGVAERGGIAGGIVAPKGIEGGLEDEEAEEFEAVGNPYECRATLPVCALVFDGEGIP